MAGGSRSFSDLFDLAKFKRPLPAQNSAPGAPQTSAQPSFTYIQRSQQHTPHPKQGNRSSAIAISCHSHDRYFRSYARKLPNCRSGNWQLLQGSPSGLKIMNLPLAIPCWLSGFLGLALTFNAHAATVWFLS